MMIGTLIFCAVLASSIGIGAGIVACCSGMVYRRHRAEKLPSCSMIAAGVDRRGVAHKV